MGKVRGTTYSAESNGSTDMMAMLFGALWVLS